MARPPLPKTRVYHPMTQGKIERYHRSMKNLILLDHYYSPTELTKSIREWVDYYNHHRYHEAINNVTPADKYYGRDKDILKNRMKIKKQTIRNRRKINKMIMLAITPCHGIRDVSRTRPTVSLRQAFAHWAKLVKSKREQQLIQ